MGSVSEKGKLNPRVKSRRAGFWREGGGDLGCGGEGDNGLVKPPTNCAQLLNGSLRKLHRPKPGHREHQPLDPSLLILPSNRAPPPPPFFILAPCWFSLGQELIPSLWLVASGGVSCTQELETKHLRRVSCARGENYFFFFFAI